MVRHYYHTDQDDANELEAIRNDAYTNSLSKYNPKPEEYDIHFHQAGDRCFGKKHERFKIDGAIEISYE